MAGWNWITTILSHHWWCTGITVIYSQGIPAAKIAFLMFSFDIGFPMGPGFPGKEHFHVTVSLCPWTRARLKILGQTPLSWDVPGLNHYPIVTKECQKGENCNFFPLYFSVSRSVLGLDRTKCYNPGLARGKILSLSCCPFVPGQYRDVCSFFPMGEENPVLLETLVWYLRHLELTHS